MAVTAPERPRRAPEVDDPERLEALIKEARRRARLRRLRNATLVVLVASAGAAAVLGPGRGGGAGGDAPEPSPAAAPWEIKLAGARLAYVPEWSQHELYVTKPDGSGAEKLAACSPWTAGCEIKSPVWSPDARRVAFLRGPLGQARRTGGPSGFALYVVGLDGRGERRLVSCRGACAGLSLVPGPPFSSLSWSPDGSQIAFTRGGLISTVNVESGRVRRLTSCGLTPCFDFSPVWSPDQTAIVFTRWSRKEQFGALYRVGVSGSHLTRLAPEGRNPAWAPDGRTILVDTRQGIVSLAADGSRTTLLAPASGGEVPEVPGFPSWSPDGSRVLYFNIAREERGHRPEVWTMEPDGSVKSRLYRGSCCVWIWFKPDWSADGSRVVLSAGRNSLKRGGGTFVVNADGTRLRKLTKQTAEFDWQPVPSGALRTRR